MFEGVKERLCRWWFLPRKWVDESGPYETPSRWEQCQSWMEYYRHKYIIKDGRNRLKYIWTVRKKQNIIAYHSLDAEEEFTKIVADQFKV